VSSRRVSGRKKTRDLVRAKGEKGGAECRGNEEKRNGSGGKGEGNQVPFKARKKKGLAQVGGE